MKAGDIVFDQVGKHRYHVIRYINLTAHGEFVSLLPDVIGWVRRRKTDRRSQIGKSRPEYYWQVTLERGDERAFFDEDEAKAWARAIVAMD